MKYSKIATKIHRIVGMIVLALILRSEIDSNIFIYYAVFGFVIIYIIELIEKYMADKVIDRGSILGIILMVGLGVARLLSDFKVF